MTNVIGSVCHGATATISSLDLLRLRAFYYSQTNFLVKEKRLHHSQA